MSNDVKRHSNVCGGSTAEVRMKCPGSLLACKAVPDEKTSEYAARGTVLHKIMEETFSFGWDDSEIEAAYLDRVIPCEGIDIHVTRELMDTKVFPAVHWFDSIANETTMLKVEPYVDLGLNVTSAGFVTIPNAFGSSDIVFETPKEAGIVDWKFGEVPVDGAEYQAKFYLAGCVMNGLLPITTQYSAYIYQPADRLSPSDYVKKFVFSLDDLVSFTDELSQSLYGPTKYVIGEHCAKCKGRIACDAFRSKVDGLVMSDVKGYSCEQLAESLALIVSVERWVKDVKAAALRNAMSGKDIPGYTLERSLGARVWVNEDAAYKELIALGADKKQLLSTTLISAPQAMALLDKLSGVTDDEKAAFAKEYVTRNDNGEKLTKIKDGKAGKDTLSKSIGNIIKKGSKNGK